MIVYCYPFACFVGSTKKYYSIAFSINTILIWLHNVITNVMQLYMETPYYPMNQHIFFIDSVVFYILYLFDNVVSCSWYRRHRVVFICFFVLLQHVVITQWLAVWMSYYYMCVHAKYRNQKVLNKPTIWKQTFLAREGPAAMRRWLQLIPRLDRAQCHWSNKSCGTGIR